MGELLRDEGYRVIVVRDGREALLYLETHPPPDLILLDLNMPGMNGVDFRHRQLEKPEWAQVPVIICSARPDVERIAESLGAADWLRKPMRFGELLHLVQNRARTTPS
jgi:putative two-component system response regulator